MRVSKTYYNSERLFAFVVLFYAFHTSIHVFQVQHASQYCGHCSAGRDADACVAPLTKETMTHAPRISSRPLPALGQWSACVRVCDRIFVDLSWLSAVVSLTRTHVLQRRRECCSRPLGTLLNKRSIVFRVCRELSWFSTAELLGDVGVHDAPGDWEQSLDRGGAAM